MVTFEELENYPHEVLPVTMVAEFLGVAPQSIRSQAQVDVHALGFGCILMGSKTLIPRRGFCNFILHGPMYVQKRSQKGGTE